MADGKKKSDTNLVEMGTILFLLAVTAGVLVPGLGLVTKRQTQQANFETCKQNLLKIHEAVDRYANNNDGKLPKFVQDVTPKILAEMPRCPEVNKATYEDKGYRVKQGNPGRYTIMCFGNYHDDVGAGINEPYYDSLYGLKPAPGKETEK